MMVRGPQGVPGVLKVAAAGSAVANLRREAQVLGRLQSDERLGAWRALLPIPLDAGASMAALSCSPGYPGTRCHPRWRVA